jgi:hypothetical protein
MFGLELDDPVSKDSSSMQVLPSEVSDACVSRGHYPNHWLLAVEMARAAKEACVPVGVDAYAYRW